MSLLEDHDVGIGVYKVNAALYLARLYFLHDRGTSFVLSSFENVGVCT